MINGILKFEPIPFPHQVVSSHHYCGSNYVASKEQENKMYVTMTVTILFDQWEIIYTSAYKKLLLSSKQRPLNLTHSLACCYFSVLLLMIEMKFISSTAFKVLTLTLLD